MASIPPASSAPAPAPDLRVHTPLSMEESEAITMASNMYSGMDFHNAVLTWALVKGVMPVPTDADVAALIHSDPQLVRCFTPDQMIQINKLFPPPPAPIPAALNAIQGAQHDPRAYVPASLVPPPHGAPNPPREGAPVAGGGRFSKEMSDAAFEAFIGEMRRDRLKLKDALKRQRPPVQTEAEFMARLTPLGQKRIYEQSIPESLEGQGYEKDRKGNYVKKVTTIVFHRGVRCKKTVTYTAMSGLEQAGKGALTALGTVASLGTMYLPKAGREFAENTLKGVNISEPEYEPLEGDKSKFKASQADEGLGYNPEEAATIDAAWAKHSAKDPKVYPFPSGETRFVVGRRYSLAQHQFIYMGEGHILLAPGGDATASFSVAFYNDKTGKPWGNKGNLKRQIALFVRGYTKVKGALEELGKSDLRHFVVDQQNCTVWAYAKHPDFSRGFTDTKGWELKIDKEFWNPTFGKGHQAKHLAATKKPREKFVEEALKRHKVDSEQLKPEDQALLRNGPKQGQTEAEWENEVSVLLQARAASNLAMPD